MDSPYYQGGLAKRRSQILQLIDEHGLTITKQGNAYRVSGKGINILAADPALLLEAELTPHTNERWRL